MRVIQGLLIAGLLALSLQACKQSSSPEQQQPQSDDVTVIADTLFYNATVYTLSWPSPALDGTPAADAPFYKSSEASNAQVSGRIHWRSDANAVAVSDGRIVAVGDNESLSSFVDDQTQKIDLKGAILIPGLVDSHAHVSELGQILSRVNLIDVPSPEDAIDWIQQQTDAQAGEWIIGQGWDEGAWANNYPNRQLLDKAFPDNPVLLKSLHGFAVWVNSAALKAANITASTKAPIGGEIVRDNNGEPTGILLNRATTLMDTAIPEPSDKQVSQWIMAGLQQMAKDGYVAIHQAGASAQHMRVFQQLREQNQLPIRVYAMLSARDESLSTHWLKQGPQIDPEGFYDVRSVKAYYDGALGSRGARLLQDYSDKPGHKGVSGNGYGFDSSLVRRLMAAGFQVGIHAIGDAGNRETLDFIESVYKQYPDASELRHRIEHAQVIHSDDFSRFADLNVIASMEPPHAVEDKTWAEDRLGSTRIKGAYAWRQLREQGVPITFNSDLPGSDHNFFYGFHAGITRRDKQQEPSDGWYPSEALTAEETLRAYTDWAAYSAFRENDTGTIEVGKWADFTVMDIDPLNTHPDKLLDGEILMTVVNGKVVYQQED